MFIRLNLLLLLLCCFISYGTDPKSVSGKKGENVILSCDFNEKKMQIVLRSEKENIDVCETEECSGRFLKVGSCDVIIKNLSFSDAGKYILRVYNNTDQTELEPQILEYQLHIHDEISVNTGEELKMDVLFSNAEKVETNSSGEWTEVWTKGQGVSSDRLTDSDENLIIKSFTSNDTGTYRVLDSKNETLITVTVTESKDGLNGTREVHTEEQNWIVPLPVLVSVLVSVSVVLLVLLAVALIIFYKRRHRNREYISESKSKSESESNGSEMCALNQTNNLK